MPALAGQLSEPPSGVAPPIVTSPMPALAGQRFSQPPSGVVGAIQPPPVRPPPSGDAANAQMLALASQRGEPNLLSRDSILASDFVLHSKPKLPWVRASELRATGPQNPNFPAGFSEINMHRLMSLTVAERLKKATPLAFQSGTPVVWPTFDVFDREHFIATRTLYYKAILASLTTGLFQDFKSTFTATSRLAMCLVFDLDELAFVALDDSTLLGYCDIHFGPKNARQAITALEAVKMDPHRDKDHSQAEFVAKFDNLRLTFELVVNDLVKCHHYWPTDMEDVDYGVVTIKNVMTAWLNIFPKPATRGKPISVQMEDCRRFIELNKETPFNLQVKKLRQIFSEQDERVRDGRAQYTTTISVSDDVKPATNKTANVTVAFTPGNAGRGGQSTKRQGQSGNDRRRQAKAPRGRGPEPAKWVKSTPGHKRCVGCGSANNHWGLGFTAKSCPAFGHHLAKPKGYVWKNTDDEVSIRIPDEEYAKILATKPFIQANWKAARAQIKTQRQARVAALAVSTSATVHDDAEESADQSADQRPDSDNDSIVNESDYFSWDSDDSNDTLAPSIQLATVNTSLAAFGHERQYFGVARFAHNDEFVAKTLMDPGAEINVISPALANRCAVKRQVMDVHIFQGKRKQGTVNELVFCPFELLSSENVWSSHAEWFAVDDMGYDVLLGRQFCRLQGLTSFDEKLASFEAYVPTARYNVAVASLSTIPNVSSLVMRVSRAPLQPGDARYKRKPKRCVATFSQGNIGVFPEAWLNAQSQYSALKVVERKQDNVDNFVRLEFTVDKDHRTFQEWFRLSNLAHHVTLPCNFAEQIDAVAVPTVSELQKSDIFCRNAAINVVTDSRNSNYGDHRGNQHDALTNSFKHSASEVAASVNAEPGITAIDEREAAPLRFRGATSAACARQQESSKLRFVSFHPVTGQRLIRAALPPLSPHQKKDHQNYLANYDYRGERAAVLAAYEVATSNRQCKKLERNLSGMMKELHKSHSAMPWKPTCPVSSLIDQMAWDTELDKHLPPTITTDSVGHAVSPTATAGQVPLRSPSRPESIVDVAASSAAPSTKSSFIQGTYAEIRNAVNKPEFNGQRVRLHHKHDADKWVVRVLGKNNGLFLCAENLLQPLSDFEQRRSVPSASDAGFDDVGIDASGQPDVELKSLAHRQFGAEYSTSLTRRIEELKLKFPAVFTTDVTEPCLFEPMKIKLIPNAILPTKARHYRNTPKMRDEIRRQIQEQLEWGCIRKCVTPHVSDVLLVKRPHMPGKFRFVVSYLKLNDATVKEQLIMPDPKSQHERLAGYKIFGALDFSSYYRQIRLHEDSQLLTGFASDEGTYCYTRVPMGITGACQYAQKVLQDALAADPVLGPLGIKNYFDDLPFGANTEDEFMHILEALLNFCERWQLKVNPDKSVLGVKSITHVGFVISEDGVAIDPERNRDIRELTSPRSIKKVQSVLGIFNYVRNFIPHFSDKAKFLTDKLASVPASSAKKRPLPALDPPSSKHSATDVAAMSVTPGSASKAIKKAVPAFSWSKQDEDDFQALKQCVLEAPMLAQLDYSLPIYIRCDASRFGAGAVLFQYDSRGYENVVCYASRKFLPAERNWSTFSQEAGTVVWALERFAEYTQGYHVIVECDHRNISFVKRSSMPQLARWRLRLQDCDFSVRYLSGPRNQTSDGLSRQHVDDVAVEFHDVLPECALRDSTAEEQRLCADISALTATMAPCQLRADREEQAGEFDEADVSSQSDSEASDPDTDDEDDYGPRGEIMNADGQPIVVNEPQPAHLQLPVIDSLTEFRNVHNDLVGHAGTFVTLQRALRNNRSWGTRKQMIADIDSFIRGCGSCQKMRKRKSATLVDRRTISGSPFSELSIDILKLPDPDSLGMKYVVVVVDSFSHWVSLVAVRNKSAFDAARALMHVVGNFGAPLRLRSDGGKEFLGGVLTGVSRLMGVSNHVVLPYTPTANGIVERANRSVLERLREMIFSKRLVRHTHHQWSDLLPMVQRSINASIHSATGTSPARILFGDNLDLDRCLLSAMPPSATLNVQKYVDALTFNQRVIIEEADAFQSKICDDIVRKSAAKQRIKSADGSVVVLPQKELSVGDWVLVKPQPNYPLHKLAPRWLGPFRIESCSPDAEVVTVFDTLKSKRRQFLRRQLELFDVSMFSEVEGLSTVAETDAFEFPVESICGHALINEGGIGSDPVQLPSTFRRGSRKKTSFQFLLRWAGYAEPSWVSYRTASRLVQFPGYVSMLPGLNME
jgi:hypothetical protein